MEVSYERFTRSYLTSAEQIEMVRVDGLAARLREHLKVCAEEIDVAHVHRASSGAIQSIVARLLREELAFTEERILTPEHGFVTQARPDFGRRTSHRTPSTFSWSSRTPTGTKLASLVSGPS